MECCVLNNIKSIKYTLAPTVLYAADEAVDPIQCSFILNDPNDNAAFLPFGSGMRACVGQKFSIHGVATLFASLLQRYEGGIVKYVLRPKIFTAPNLRTEAGDASRGETFCFLNFRL
ncbi:hypothetical protein NC651_000420 [Populus alba x Populus x berolinensis]|nr:hypothetical protein NC651_000420 [Populus alba x Populus x berolinensis]